MSYHSPSDSDGGQAPGPGSDALVWRRVRVTVHCHSRGFSQLVTILDPVSKYMFAESVPAGCENIPNFIASFMFKTFCCFGFPRVELYNINSIQFEMILVEYNYMVMRASEVIPDLKSLQGDLVLKSNDESFPDQDITNHLINPNDVSTSLWLLGLRLQKNGAGPSPFQMIFSRRIVERSLSSAEPELRQTRRKLQSSVLHCRHCDESFTSKISFRIHQRRHTEEARLRGQREGEAVREKISEDEEEADAKEETSGSPSKRPLARRTGHGRNRLQKRRRLAKLAEKWPVDDNHPEEDKKHEVSEHAAEAVRVLLKATREERQRRGKYLSYSPELRDEIAEHAIAHGQAQAAQLYSEKLGFVVAESSVRNFVRVFNKYPPQLRLEIGNYAGEHGLELASKYYSAKLGQDVSRGMVRRFRKQFASATGGAGPGVTRSGGGAQVFSQELREEIGQYAGLHGVEATVQVYSDRLLFSVRPSTVRKFRSLYGESGADTGAYIQLSESSSTTIDLLHSSLDVLNQHGPSYIQSSYVNQTSFLGHQQEKIEPSSSRLNPAIDVKSEPKPETQQMPKEVKKSSKKPSRGRYVQYSDELRAKIGKFALRHGNSAAMKHFYTELGHEIPESTIRGMRDKYQLMAERAGPGGVASLGCGPRGRPASLGSHDTLVQEAVKKLAAKGEKITTFVVIAVAKQVIQAQDPALLHDSGGPIKLNTTWAKSMMRRLGIKNKI